MGKQFIKDAVGWGFILWLIGYLLGIILFFFVPPSLIGWIIMPIGIFILLYVLLRKIKNYSLVYLLKLGIVWTILAIVLDYFLLVKLLKPEDGYYKLDVYLYYLSTFILPLFLGIYKSTKK